MSDISRGKKEYSVNEKENILFLENEPPGYEFTIGTYSFNFKVFKRADVLNEDIGWAVAKYFWWRKNEMRLSTLKNNYQSIVRLFEFIDRQRGDVKKITQMDENFLYSYIYWLKNLAKNKNTGELLSSSSQKTFWCTCRDFINRLQIEGLIAETVNIPQNSYPGITDNSYKPLSEKEVEQLLAACKYEITRIRKDAATKERVSVADLLPYALLVSIRTGINPEVLFDMEVTSKSIVKGYLNRTERLVLPVKNRSRKSQNMTIQASVSDERLRVKSRISNLLREVDDITSELRAGLDEESDLKGLLWIVRKVQAKSISKFSDVTYNYEVKRFSKRYQLVDDFGEPMVLNFRRLRPTFAEGYLKANGGDFRDLQKRLNHSSISTTMKYLDPNLEDRVNAFRFAGRSMVEWATEGEDLIKDFDISPKSVKKLINGDHDTPVSKCIDPLNSPLKGVKSGVLCTEFLGCFRCGNMLVLKEDSRKLFSFYHWLKDKELVIGVENWEKSYSWVIRIIDRDIAPQLGDIEWVIDEKKKAKEDPFPLWRTMPSIMNGDV